MTSTVKLTWQGCVDELGFERTRLSFYCHQMSLKLTSKLALKKTWRNPWLPACLAAIGLVILAGSLDYTLTKSFIEPRLQQALQRDTGYAIRSMKSASFNALPWPSIRIEELDLVKPGSTQERVSIPVVKARLNLAAWISGNPRITALILLRPQLRLAGDINVTETEAMSATVFQELRRDRRPELSSLRVIEGTVWRDEKPWMSGLNLNVLNHVGHDMRVRASAFMRGVPFRLSSDINQTEGYARRPIAWNLATAAGEISFSGLLMGRRSLDAEGSFSLLVRDASLLADNFTLSRDYLSLINGMRISGETRVALPLVQIRSATVTRGDERMTGSVELSLGGTRPTLSATLHAPKFDLLPLALPFLSPMTTPAGKWAVSQLPYDWMQAAQVDVRLSAEVMSIARHTVQNAALSAQLNSGRFELTLNEGRLNGGAAKGRMSFNTAGDKPDMRLGATIERMDFGALLTSWNINRLKGMGSLNLQLDSRGSTMFDIAGNISGRISLGLRDGELLGLDMDKLAMRGERGTPGINPFEGRTRFSRIQTELQIKDGVGVLADSFLSRGPIRLPVDGKIHLQQQLLDLTLKLPAIPFRDPGGDTRIRIEGPWANPAVYPDLTGTVPNGVQQGGKAGRT